MRKLATTTLAGLVLLTGCTNTSDEETTSTPETSSVPTTTAPETTPEETPTTPSETPSPEPSETYNTDQTEAMNVVGEVLRLYDELPRDINSDIDPLMAITVQPAQSSFRGELIGYKEDRLQVAGEGYRFHVQEATEPTEKNGDPYILVKACTDFGGTYLENVDTGERVEAEDDIRYLVWEFDVVRDHGSDWLVGDARNEIVEECEIP